jgi:hypothetical protein
MNNPRRYEDDLFTEVGSKISSENVERMQQTDPSRAKFLSSLVKHKKLQLGGRRTKISNNNKKKYRSRSSSRRRYGKKSRKSMKRE